MNQLMLHEFHNRRGARFTQVGGQAAVADYGDWRTEHSALRQAAGVLDLSFRGRLCLVGADRARFLHGQVTNDVNRLRPGEGCYAALTTLKGRMEADLNILCLAEELLLDFEPGRTAHLTARLERHIVADDVQLVDAAPHYGLLSVQGVQAEAVVRAAGLFTEFPARRLDSRKTAGAAGDIYLVNQPRLDAPGFDLFVPNADLESVAAKLLAAGGWAAGWTALETARIEAGIPRFGADMDENTLPLECGIESRAVVYNKGCYVGQEVINRIHSFGHVTRELRGLWLAADIKTLPQPGDKLMHAGQEVGAITSAAWSPVFGANLALGYVRRAANQPGTELILWTAAGESLATVSPLPFVPP